MRIRKVRTKARKIFSKFLEKSINFAEKTTLNSQDEELEVTKSYKKKHRKEEETTTPEAKRDSEELFLDQGGGGTTEDFSDDLGSGRKKSSSKEYDDDDDEEEEDDYVSAKDLFDRKMSNLGRRA